VINLLRKATLLAIAIVLSAVFVCPGDLPVDISSASPVRGKLALTSKGCITCHSIWGVGGKLGPDLATAGADQSFQQIASMFWNHTPRMVQLMKQKGSDWPALSEQEMADIISFIYYLKLLDQPGDSNRGKALYREKKCPDCHSIRGPQIPLERFGAYISPVTLAQAMWNSGPVMQSAQRAAGIDMPLFQGRDMADLQAYIRSETSVGKVGTKYLSLPDIGRGSSLFRSKGCVSCHRTRTGPDLARLPLRKTMSEICGILWNHSFAMQARMRARKGNLFHRLEGNELADILAYIYFLHFSRDEGDASRGESVFHNKGCANCHEADESKHHGPNLTGGNADFTMLRLATSMWNHAPIMYESMENEVMKWIRLEPDDMQDLSKYLRRAKPSP
jgi:cytochrome c551/c552